MPTKWLQERAKGSKNEHGMPPHRAFCGIRCRANLKYINQGRILAMAGAIFRTQVLKTIQVAPPLASSTSHLACFESTTLLTFHLQHYHNSARPPAPRFFRCSRRTGRCLLECIIRGGLVLAYRGTSLIRNSPPPP